MCYTNIQPKLENRHLSGVRQGKNTFFFKRYFDCDSHFTYRCTRKTDRIDFTGGKESGNIIGFFHENFTE